MPWDKPTCKEEEGTVKDTKKEWIMRENKTQKMCFHGSQKNMLQVGRRAQLC